MQKGVGAEKRSIDLKNKMLIIENALGKGRRLKDTNPTSAVSNAKKFFMELSQTGET